MRKFTTEWHLFSEELPEPGRSLLYAITYNQRCGFPSIVGMFRITTDDFPMNDPGTEYVAWAYIDDEFPKAAVEEWKKNNIKSDEQVKLEKIKDLEREIEKIKSEL